MTTDEARDAPPGASPMALDLPAGDTERAVEAMIEHGLRVHASDLYLSAEEQFIAIQARALGIVHRLCIVSAEEGRRMISHLKAMAGMNVAERRRPLDGRSVYALDGRDVDLRISTIPTIYGEDAALRLLPRDTDLRHLDNLGLHEEQYARAADLLDSPGGMILCTGPTGSGKTATLYACLHRLHDDTRRINTIEDPVEYSIAGVRQSQVQPKLGVGFDDLLRAVLRQGPDVIMIGEVRDPETAHTAVRAANSGHLVLATMHAPVAAVAVQAMRAFGIQPHFLASALRGVITQRLVRTLCPDCRAEFPLEDADAMFGDVRRWLRPGEGDVFYAPAGCDACHFQGYAGRTGVFEIMPVDNKLRNLIAHDAPVRELHPAAVESGMIEFRHAAMLKVARGQTSTEEVFRVIPSEHILPND